MMNKPSALSAKLFEALTKRCPTCHASGWLCELHTLSPMGHAGCGHGGKPCKCNPERVVGWDGEWQSIIAQPLDKALVYGPFDDGILTFRTGDAVLARQLQADWNHDRLSTVLLSVIPMKEFTGELVKVELVKVERPQQWQITMVEHLLPRGKWQT